MVVMDVSVEGNSIPPATSVLPLDCLVGQGDHLWTWEALLLL